MGDPNILPMHNLGSTNHPNPMFDFLTGFVPRKLKDLFRWTEYLYYNSSHVYVALTKLADYIITDVVFDTDSPALRKRYSDALKKSLKILAFLKACARDRSIYGNSFVSIYFPFKRMLPCTKCPAIWDIRRVGTYEYEHKKRTFSYRCPACDGQSRTHLDDVRDFKIKAPHRINLIRWDPKLIDIDKNPITGETTYFYNIPSEVKEKLKKGDPLTINTLPKNFLEAADDDQIFEFEPDKIFHMKVDAPAGIDSAWGFPPLTATLKQFYYTQVLRKANEAIALDHLVPYRVLHPAQTGASNDPVTKMAISQWVDETKKNIKQWRRDPLHIQFAPVALGVTQMGGQGRTLLTLGEVREAEGNIITAMGIPREFLEGGLSYTGSSVTLRMLENQLLAHKADILELLQWITNALSAYMGWKKIDVDITNFRFVDDVQQKSMLLQLNAQKPVVSDRTISEIFDVDFDAEQEEIQKEIIEAMRRQAETDKKIQELQTSLDAEASRRALTGEGMAYDQQAMIANGQQIVDQLAQMDEGMRKSRFHQLQMEDFVMYAVVIQLWDQMKLNRENEAVSQLPPM